MGPTENHLINFASALTGDAAMTLTRDGLLRELAKLYSLAKADYKHHEPLGKAIDVWISTHDCALQAHPNYPLHWAREFNPKKQRLFGYSAEALNDLHTCLVELVQTKNAKRPASRESNKPEAHDAPNNTNTHTVRLTVSALPETALPYIFTPLYKHTLPINIKLKEYWGNFSEPFEKGWTDVAVHNFSTVLSYNRQCVNDDARLLFFPLFAFKGYGVIADSEHFAQHQGKTRRKNQEFLDWDEPERAKLIRSARCLLELGTDLEWIYRKFCEEHGCDFDALVANGLIEDLTTEEARKHFVNRRGAPRIMCTNEMNILALSKKRGITRLERNFKHRNYNGFVCTRKFYETRTRDLVELIHCWFKSIELLTGLIGPSQEEPHPLNGLHPSLLLDALQKMAGSKEMGISDLLSVYKTHNDFYLSYPEAVKAFRSEVLGDASSRTAHDEIARIQWEARQAKDASRRAASASPTEELDSSSIGQGARWNEEWWLTPFTSEFNTINSEAWIKSMQPK